MIIIQKNNYLLKLMQNDQNKYIKDDIAHRNANENNENIPFKRKMKISDKNQVLNGFFLKMIFKCLNQSL